MVNEQVIMANVKQLVSQLEKVKQPDSELGTEDFQQLLISENEGLL